MAHLTRQKTSRNGLDPENPEIIQFKIKHLVRIAALEV
jgi:hypothetical protein